MGNDLISGGLGADVLEGGFGNDILIDGTVTLIQPNSDSLTKVLSSYRPWNIQTLRNITSRIAVTLDTTRDDTLLGANGTDWFWSNDGLDILDRLALEPWNAVT
jgi:Ca2+-binding RTX toxin-like protein